MAHLLDYEEAVSEKDKAYKAIEIVHAKNSKRLAWSWVETAAQHAQKAGLENAWDEEWNESSFLGSERWPNVDNLKNALDMMK